ncbi:MAG: phosphoribosyl-AMP cyclohydrolase [Nitrososphaerota archaeon]|nr:phosphoribosyl-AMP cyclohydrolase [Candidatus Bathyarchaeota archaeon]MDW8048495.1 phosphoribosyl-AMP cyclohydrolase [Nitrososphaerota archaeon]
MNETKEILDLDDIDFKKGGGLVPVVVQDTKTLKVLSLAYANREALEKTIKTGYAHFFRRSLGRVMKKGETSGHVMRVKEILIDCDRDAILYLVEPSGPACHLGEETCFHNLLKHNEKIGV